MMIDYSELESKFKNFRRMLVKYSEILELLKYNIFNKKLAEKEEKMRTDLTRIYGELESYIHKTAGYTTYVVQGQNVNPFFAALNPDNINIFWKEWGIKFSIQCLDKAIGGCRYTSSVEKKGDQVIIHKGGNIEGWLTIISIFKDAKSKILIRDRYLDERIFSIIKALNSNIDTKILIMKESYNEKNTLELIYKEYKKSKSNVEIRELTRTKFHSREIIIDDKKGYELTFSIKDVGLSEGRIHKLKSTDIKNTLSKFKGDWNLASKI